MTRWGKEPAVPELKVVTQYWRGRVRVCELEKEGKLLDLRISRVDDSNAWDICAQSGRADGAHVFSKRGNTRSAALSAIATSWTAEAPALGLPAFDWDAVATALRAVNAVE
jgi:hypothetical protein